MPGVIEQALLKVSTSAVQKLTGLGVRRLRAQHTARKVKENLAETPALADAMSRLNELDPTTTRTIQSFCDSPELEHLAFTLATYYGVEACGKTAAKPGELRIQFREALRLTTGTSGQLLDDIADILFAVVEQFVVHFSERFSPDNPLPPITRAALIKSAASLAAASTRATELMQKLDDLTELRSFEEDLRSQIRNMHGTMRLPHAGTSRQVPYERLFVAPTVSRISDADASMSLGELVSNSVRTILLGDPGGGKSTSSLKLAYDIASGKIPSLTATTPFLIVLRDYADEFKKYRTSLIDYLDSLARAPYSLIPPDKSIEYLLLSGRAFVIFDGLDELLDTSLRREVVQIVEGFTYRYPTTSILVTSRRIGYEEAPLDPDLFIVSGLEEFSMDQVEAYVRKWFSLDDSIANVRKSQLVEAFLQDSEFVSDLRVNPLMLSLMCGIYATENYIPRNRPDVYEKCALLLFDRWDKQRGINAPLSFDAHVQAAMRSLALWLYPKQEAQQGLPREELISYMKSYLLAKRFDNEEDAEQAATEFIDFCKGRAWVLTDIGADLYGFTHRTFLEYFAASQLVRLHPSAEKLIDELWAHLLRSEWDVVAQLALQILGRTVEDGADNALQLIVDRLPEIKHLDTRRNLVSFLCRALSFIVPRPSVLRAIVEAAVDSHLDVKPAADPIFANRRPKRPVVELVVEATTENLPLVGRYLRETVQHRLELDSDDQRALALGILLPLYAQGTATFRSRLDSSFWSERMTENREAFLGYSEDQATRHIWIAARLVEWGHLSAATLLERFGIEGIYNFDTAGDVLEGPLAFRIALRAAGVDHSNYPADIVRDIHDFVLASPPPWLSFHESYERLAISLYDVARGRLQRRDNPVDPLLASTAALLTLPLWEIMEDRDDKSRGRGALLHRFLDKVSDKTGRRPTPLARLSLSPDEEALIDDWLAGRVTLLSGLPVRFRRSRNVFR